MVFMFSLFTDISGHRSDLCLSEKRVRVTTWTEAAAREWKRGSNYHGLNLRSKSRT